MSKQGSCPSLILMQDFTSKGTAGEFQRGYYQYYKYVTGVSMLMCFSTTAFLTRNSNMSSYASTTEKEDAVCIPDLDLLSPAALIFAESFHILIEN